MKFRTAHAKVLSLLLALVMVLSTAAVFAEGEENVATGEPDVTVQEEQSSEPADENSETVPAEENEVVDQVEEPTMDVAGVAPITVDPTEATIKVGESVTLTATKADSALEGDIQWRTSSDAIATVNGGFVKGVGAGNATITAFIKVDEETEYAADCAVTVEAVTVPEDVQAKIKYRSGDNGLDVTWTWSGSDPAKFEILRGNNTADVNKMSVIDTVSGSARSYHRLESKGNFYYAVREKGSTAASKASNKVTISGNILPTIEELKWYSHTKKKVTLYRTAKLKGKVATLPKGTYVQAIGKSPKKVKKFKQPSKVQVRAKVNGKTVTGWVKYNQLKGGVKADTTVSQDFTQSALEDFVNEHGYSSTNNKLIWVSPRTQRAYYFTGKKGHWELKKRFRVTTGRFSHKTAPYHSAISKKKAKVWMVTEKGKRYYYKTASYFASGVSFHTGTWWANGKVRGVMNKKGVPQTFGCLRMANSEAGWIYNNVPYGTTVIVKKDAA